MADGDRAEPEEGAAAEADYVFLQDEWELAAPLQKWFCAACGKTVGQGDEAAVRAWHEKRTTYAPVLVHAHCRDSLLQAGSWSAWRARIENDADLYNVEAARGALEAAVPPPDSGAPPRQKPPRPDDWPQPA